MYSSYFGLREPSFSIAPDPQYLYLGEQHREALAHLLYGAGDSGGFVLLTGEVGTGKTTVCRAFLEQLPDGVDVALILNPALTADELLLTICEEFHVEVPPDERSIKRLIDRLNRYLLEAHAQGRRPLVIIDEAQNLSPRVMEQVRLLTNLETTRHKLLRIFLVGQPELRRMLASDELRQIDQRITARVHLRPLTLSETGDYIRHRIAVAGVERPLFTAAAIRRIHRYAGGIPRLINILCDRALLGACVTRVSQVTPGILDRAAREIRGAPLEAGRSGGARIGRLVLLGALAFALAVPAGWLGYEWRAGRGPEEVLARWLGAGGAPAVSASPTETAVAPTGAADSPTADGAGTAGDADGENIDRPPPPGSIAPVASAPAPTGSAGASASQTLASASGASVAKDAASAAADGAGAPAVDQAVPSPDASPAALPADHAAPALSAQDAAKVSADAAARPPPLPPGVSLDRLALREPEALRILLRRWSLELETLGEGDPCRRVESFGLRCLRGQGNLRDARLLDRPLLLRVGERDGAATFLVLGALDMTGGTLDFPSGRARVPIEAFERLWTGDYLLVWQPPPTGRTVIGSSASAEEVRWLRRLLDRVPGGGFAVGESPEFDQGLRNAVRAFQRARGLPDDGLAGPQTLIQLDNAVRMPGTPHLIPVDQEGAAAAADRP